MARKLSDLRVGETVTVLPSRYGRCTYKGPAEVVRVDQHEVLVEFVGTNREVWFFPGRIAELVGGAS